MEILLIDFNFWCLMPLSAISWQAVLVMEEAGVPSTDHGQATGKLYHIYGNIKI